MYYTSDTEPRVVYDLVDWASYVVLPVPDQLRAKHVERAWSDYMICAMTIEIDPYWYVYTDLPAYNPDARRTWY